MVNKQLQDARSADAAPNPQFCTPWGRELVISAIKGTALYCINYGDGKGGNLPEQYSGRYTKPDYAAEDLKLCLAEMRYVAAKLEQANEVPVAQAAVIPVQLPVIEKPKRRGRPPKTVVETTQLQV